MQTTRLGLLAVTLLAASTAAQTYRTERIDRLGVELKVHKGLQRVPMRLGGESPYVVATWEPKDKRYNIKTDRGTMRWGMAVLTFDTTAEDQPEQRLPTLRSFDQYLELRRFSKHALVLAGEERKGNSGGLDHRVYDADFNLAPVGSRLYYSRACVYTVGTEEIAVIVYVPMGRKKKTAFGKGAGYLKKMTTSLRVVEKAAEKAAQTDTPRGDDDKRNAFAVTPEQRATLDRVLANIGDLRNWDHFTTPTHVVVYSWGTDHRTHADARAYARKLADRLGPALEFYNQVFPPYEGFAMPYPVLRVCGDMRTFRQYSRGAPRNVIGWYARDSRELVVFRETRGEIRNASVYDVLYHEGWHQFSHAYFGRALHPVFEEGLGEYFGAFRRSSGKWRFRDSKMRKGELKIVFARDLWAPLPVLFEAKNALSRSAPAIYAQGYSLMVYLLHGKSVGARPDPAWVAAFHAYCTATRKGKDPDDALHDGFGQVNLDQLDQEWRDWARRRYR